MYVLMNKNTPVATFELHPIGADCLTVKNVEILLPNPPSWLDEENISNTLARQILPIGHRANSFAVCSRYAIIRPNDVIKRTYCTSLSNTLWIKSASDTLGWKEVNPYTHPLHTELSAAMLTGESVPSTYDPKSPEFTLDASLPKCWVELNNQKYLAKGGTSGASNSGREPYAEYFGHQLLEFLRWDHVPYDITTLHSTLVSICPLMTSEYTALLPIHHVADFGRDIDAYGKYYTKHGWAEQFSQMLTFDALVGNIDRHLNNFGLLYDTDSFSIKGPAPIYDNGFSIISLGVFNTFAEAINRREFKRACLYDDFLATANNWLTRSVAEDLRRLSTFKLRQHPNFPIDQTRLNILSSVIQHRAGLLLSMWNKQ